VTNPLGLMTLVNRALGRGRSYFEQRLRQHFGDEPKALSTLAESIDKPDYPNLHLAIQSFLDKPGRSGELVGITGFAEHSEINLSTLLAAPSPFMTPPSPGPVQRINVPLNDGGVLACVHTGLYLIRNGVEPLAILVAAPRSSSPFAKICLDVMARDPAAAERALGELRATMRARNIYRGQTVSLVPERYGDSVTVQFHPLREIKRDQIVLPEGVLDRIERQTIGFSKHGAKLLAAGRHLKRGMLLHGPPGTGKTLTAMYIASRMRDRTNLLLTGRGLGIAIFRSDNQQS